MERGGAIGDLVLTWVLPDFGRLAELPLECARQGLFCITLLLFNIEISMFSLFNILDSIF